MIPILSGIIAGQGHRPATPGALPWRLPTSWAWRSPTPWRASPPAFPAPWFPPPCKTPGYWGFALVFVVLSLSMFGFYDLQLPTALQSKFSEEAGHLQGGRGVGVFLMGALSA